MATSSVLVNSFEISIQNAEKEYRIETDYGIDFNFKTEPIDINDKKFLKIVIIDPDNIFENVVIMGGRHYGK